MPSYILLFHIEATRYNSTLLLRNLLALTNTLQQDSYFTIFMSSKSDFQKNPCVSYLKNNDLF